MKIRKAIRKKAKIKLALQGPSGSGKTYSALLLGRGLTTDWNKVVIVDTENNSADLYAHLGEYNVIPLGTPHSPERYAKAIEACIEQNVDVIILDSISHCWDYLLDCHAQMTGNSFKNWNQITPRHKSFIQKILTTNLHVIVTMRTKQDYVLNLQDGKHIPEKVGLKAIQRDGVDYEFTVLFELDANNKAKASKDRTRLFAGTTPFVISEETGTRIKLWCNQGISADQVIKKIQDCPTLSALTTLYHDYPEWQIQLEPQFTVQKNKIIQSNNQKSKSNGTTAS